MPTKRSRIEKVAIMVCSFGFFAAIAGLFLDVLHKVLTGHGLDTYHSVSLIELNYLGVLIMLCTIPVALLGALFFVWRERALERDLLKKYGRKK